MNYSPTEINGKSIYTGERKIKATQNSLEGIKENAKSLVVKIKETVKSSIIDRLAEKGVTMHNIVTPNEKVGE